MELSGNTGADPGFVLGGGVGEAPKIMCDDMMITDLCFL